MGQQELLDLYHCHHRHHQVLPHHCHHHVLPHHCHHHQYVVVVVVEAAEHLLPHHRHHLLPHQQHHHVHHLCIIIHVENERVASSFNHISVGLGSTHR